MLPYGNPGKWCCSCSYSPLDRQPKHPNITLQCCNLATSYQLALKLVLVLKSIGSSKGGVMEGALLLLLRTSVMLPLMFAAHTMRGFSQEGRMPLLV